MFTSKRKRGKNFVIFRNSSNTKLRGTAAFHTFLTVNGFDTSFLETAVFKSDRKANIVCNKVGANVVAKKEALLWIEDVEDNKLDKMNKSVERSSSNKISLKHSNPDIISNINVTKNMGNTVGLNKENSKEEENTSEVDPFISDLTTRKFEFENEVIDFSMNNLKRGKDSDEGIPWRDTSFKEDNLDIVKYEEMSKDDDTPVDQSVIDKSVREEEITGSKSDEQNKYNLGSIDYSWMDSFGCAFTEEVNDEQIGNGEKDNTKSPQLDCIVMKPLSHSDDGNILVNDTIIKNKKQGELESSNYDCSWMDLMGCDSDSAEQEDQIKNTETLSIQNCNKHENKEINMANNIQEKKREEKIIKLGPIDYSWMDSMGNMSDIEEEESLICSAEKVSKKKIPINHDNSDENNNEDINIYERNIVSLELGNIGSSWMDSLGGLSDSGEKEKEETKHEHAVSKPESTFNSSTSSLENDEMNFMVEANEKCIPWILKNEHLNASRENLFENTKMPEPNDDTAKNKMSILKEILGQKKEGAENKEMFVGDFCEAWMECFQSITELDSNLKEKRVQLDEGLDNKLMDDFTVEKGDEIAPSTQNVLLDKKTKDNLNHKIAKACSDSSKTTIEENEMFQLLENVLLNRDELEAEDPGNFDIPKMKLEGSKSKPDENRIKDKENMKASNLFKFGDAETFKWDLRHNLEDFAKQKNNSKYSPNSKLEKPATVSSLSKDEGMKEKQRLPVKADHNKTTTSHYSFKNMESEADSFFLPNFLKFQTNIEKQQSEMVAPSKPKATQENVESICPFSYNLGFYSSPPVHTLPEDSDSSYMEEDEKISVAKVTNKKQKRRKILKGKLRKSCEKHGKEKSIGNKNENPGEHKSINTKCTEDCQGETEKVPNKDTSKPVDKPHPSPSDYSSNWETDEDEEVCPQHSSDNMEDA